MRKSPIGRQTLLALGSLGVAVVALSLQNSLRPAPAQAHERSAASQAKKASPGPATGVVSALSREQFDRLHRLMKPQPGEWKFAEIPWEPTIWEARKKAAQTGKPLFIWYMVGEPLGQC